MIAVLGGLGAAVLFATATVSAARGSRLVGAESFLAGVMTVGLVIASPLVALGGAPAGLEASSFGWLALSGIDNVAGLLFDYAALRVGRLGLVAPILATEGAIAALISVAAGETARSGRGRDARSDRRRGRARDPDRLARRRRVGSEPPRGSACARRRLQLRCESLCDRSRERAASPGLGAVAGSARRRRRGRAPTRIHRPTAANSTGGAVDGARGRVRSRRVCRLCGRRPSRYRDQRCPLVAIRHTSPRSPESSSSASGSHGSSSPVWRPSPAASRSSAASRVEAGL